MAPGVYTLGAMVMHEGEGPIPGPPAGGRRDGLLTPELQDEIVGFLQDGAFYDEAARAAGISKTTLFAWKNRGAEARDRNAAGHDLNVDDVRYMDFTLAIEKARAKATVKAHGCVRRAMDKGNWQAGAWYLERTNPRRYARRTWSEEEIPTVEELEDVPAVEAADEEADVAAVVTFAERWLAERGRAQGQEPDAQAS